MCHLGPWLLQLGPTIAWNALLRVQGADIGTGACILSSGFDEPDMLRVGEGTIIGPDVAFVTHILDKGAFSYVPIVVGEDCTLDEGIAARVVYVGMLLADLV